jgi:hypothetical protein
MTMKITSTRYGQSYRCVITDAHGNTATSDAASIVKPAAPLTITSQPVDFTGEIGDTATFTVAATGDGVTYRWQMSKDGGRSWSNVSGATAATFSVGVTATKLTYQFRCVLTDAGGNTATTNAVRMIKAAAAWMRLNGTDAAAAATSYRKTSTAKYPMTIINSAATPARSLFTR